jgi:para-aminobenzoate synthetase component 1
MSRRELSPLLFEVHTERTPLDLCRQFNAEDAPILLGDGTFAPKNKRFSFLTAWPVLRFESRGSKCDIFSDTGTRTVFGNPWNVLNVLLARFELLDQLDLPFPLGGCFGYWGYDLRHFVEQNLPKRAINDLELPDCAVGFYPSLVVFDHQLQKQWIVATGLDAEGNSSSLVQRQQRERWERLLDQVSTRDVEAPTSSHKVDTSEVPLHQETLDKKAFTEKVLKIQQYIRQGDIYQANLARRITVTSQASSLDLFRQLNLVSPTPFPAFIQHCDHAIISASPELYLKMSGREICTQPTKGTRPRSQDASLDEKLSYELRTSEKENAELLMITDLLRNDLGRICDYGTVRTPELMRLEKYAYVQHLNSTITGTLRRDLNHLDALATTFPGGSITGAPKVRAMEIIDELEPVTRGPYTGSIGYLGFNRESQLSIAIRTIIKSNNEIHYYTGAGIVSDSVPDLEYEETQHKAEAFFRTLQELNSRLCDKPTNRT